jgi:hypothetical protein
MSQDVPPDAEERARVLFGDLVEGRWEKACREFDVGLRRCMDVDRMALGWAHMAESIGMGASSARLSGDYTVVDIPLVFGAGEAAGRVVFDPDGKVRACRWNFPADVG